MIRIVFAACLLSSAAFAQEPDLKAQCDQLLAVAAYHENLGDPRDPRVWQAVQDCVQLKVLTGADLRKAMAKARRENIERLTNAP